MEKESKARETMRYLGYSLGAVVVLAVTGILYWILAPIMEFLQLIIWLGSAAFFVFLCIAAVFYLFLDPDRK